MKYVVNFVGVKFIQITNKRLLTLICAVIKIDKINIELPFISLHIKQSSETK